MSKINFPAKYSHKQSPGLLTLVVAADEPVSGVAREGPGVPQSEPVPGPLDGPDLVVDPAGQSHLREDKVRGAIQREGKQVLLNWVTISWSLGNNYRMEMILPLTCSPSIAVWLSGSLMKYCLI